MKIEKVSDFQIRCTLTKDDLARHGLKVKELAYGTPAARQLFQDMMKQAGEDFGFAADDMPIMVEAIPMNSDCVILVITKCDDPEELDSRFVSFAPSVFYKDELDDEDEDETDSEEDDFDEDEDDAFDEDIRDEAELPFSELFMRIQEGGMTSLFDSEQPSVKKVKKRSGVRPRKYTDSAPFRVYTFPLLMDVMNAANHTLSVKDVRNTLYQDKDTGAYMLLLHRTSDDDKAFSKLCLLLTEYGSEDAKLSVSEEFLEEHYRVILRDCALESLRDKK